MIDKTNRYLIPAQGSEVDPIKRAFKLLGEISLKVDKPINVVLLIPTKHNIQGTTLEIVVGKRVAKALLKGKLIKLLEDVYMKLETQRTFIHTRGVDVIIGVYVTEKMLDQIDDRKNVKIVIIVPWLMDEAANWRKTWNPQIPGEALAVPEILINNPVVEEALRALTRRINLSTGLSHPRDEAAAIELFHVLVDNREGYDSNSIKAWALRNNWDSSGANQLKEIAQAILDGKSLRGDKYSHWSPNLIEILRENARNLDSKEKT
jgi:hypothetical protein